MSSVYIMMSSRLSTWAKDRGLGEHVVKIGYTNDDVRIRHLEIMVAEYGGVKDWLWSAERDVFTPYGKKVEQAVHAALREDGKWLDPFKFPALRDQHGRPSTELFLIAENDAYTRVRAAAKSAERWRPFGRYKKSKYQRKRRFWTFRRIVFAILCVMIAPALCQREHQTVPSAKISPSVPAAKAVGQKTGRTQAGECFNADKDLGTGKIVKHQICLDADGVWRDKGIVKP